MIFATFLLKLSANGDGLIFWNTAVDNARKRFLVDVAQLFPGYLSSEFCADDDNWTLYCRLCNLFSFSFWFSHDFSLYIYCCFILCLMQVEVETERARVRNGAKCCSFHTSVSVKTFGIHWVRNHAFGVERCFLQLVFLGMRQRSMSVNEYLSTGVC